MKYLFILAILTWMPAKGQPLPVSSRQNSTGYSITLELKNYRPGGYVFLKRYNGKTLVSVDSLKPVASKPVVFKGSSPLLDGMYCIIPNQTVRIDFFISKGESLNFRILADANNPLQSPTFFGSLENQLFTDINRMMEFIRNGDDTKQKQLEEVVHDFEKKAPGAMLPLFMKSIRNPVIQEPKIPGVVLNREQQIRDHIRRQFLEHYFDNIEFSDERILTFPVLEEKTATYFRQIVQPHPDTLQFRIIKFLAQAKASEKVYLWGVRYLYELFREASFPGSAGVCSFIATRYILPESWRWKDAGFIDKVRTRFRKANRNAPGTVSTDLVLKTPEGITKSLHSVVSRYTILYFFNPGCESCLPVTTELSNLYQRFKRKGISVFAVYPDKNKDEWLKYIHSLKPGWINVYDPDGTQKIEEKYDIFAIPLIYLLDKDKTVIKKDMPVDELEHFLSGL